MKIIELTPYTDKFRIHVDERNYSVARKWASKNSDTGVEYKAESHYNGLADALQDVARKVTLNKVEKVSLSEYIGLYRAESKAVRELLKDIKT